MNEINSILKKVLGDIKPSKEDMKNVNNSLNEFLKKNHGCIQRFVRLVITK